MVILFIFVYGFNLYFTFCLYPFICIIITLLFNTIQFVRKCKAVRIANSYIKWHLFKELDIPFINSILQFVHIYYDSLSCVSFLKSNQLYINKSDWGFYCHWWNRFVVLGHWVHTHIKINILSYVIDIYELTLLYYNLFNIWI